MSYNKYARSLSGKSVIGFVAKNVAYTAQTTLALLASAGVQGELGVYNPDTQALYTGALTEGQRYVIAQLRDGYIKQSPTLVWSASSPIVKRNYSAPVLQVSTVVLSYSGDGLSQDTFELKIIETTPLSQHLPVYNFSIADAVNLQLGTSLVPITADVIAQLFVAQINNTANPTYTQSQPVCTAAWGGAGTGSITLTAIDPNSHFRSAFSGPDTISAVYSLVTPFAPGSGTAVQVAYIEAEALVDDSGVGTNYPQQALPSEFHVPTVFTDILTPATYDQFFIRNIKTEVSAGLNDMHPTPINVFIAEVAGSGSDSTLTTILGPATTLTT